jgi:hypothetical protein
MRALPMRTLMAAVIVMGVLIVLGITTIVVTIGMRMSGPRQEAGAAAGAVAQAVLDEPAGTRIAGVALAADRVAVQLQGGGADRVVVLDTAGRVLARIGLAK